MKFPIQKKRNTFRINLRASFNTEEPPTQAGSLYSGYPCRVVRKKKLFCSGPSGGTGGVPPASPTGLVAGDNTGGMPGHVFGHQAPPTRPLEAARAACSTSRQTKSKVPELTTRGAESADPETEILKFQKIQKFLQNFQSTSFCLKIALVTLWICISHAPASFAMKLI